jgi:riboflavin biosynthesis pyrimidine reductase
MRRVEKMNRPKVIIYVTSSLDGRIALGPNLTLSNLDSIKLTQPRFINLHGDWKKFENNIKSLHNPDAQMEGSNMIMYEGQEVKALPEYKGLTDKLFQDYLPDEITNRPQRKRWLIIVDGQGRIRDGYKGDEDNKQSHMLHLVSKKVAPEYLNFLQNNKIPYLISGDNKVNLKEALEKLYNKLQVKTIIISSGGKLSGALIRQDLIDEINILVNPVIIGGFKTPILFASTEINPPQVLPTKLKLISYEVNADESIWIRYKTIQNN